MNEPAWYGYPIDDSLDLTSTAGVRPGKKLQWALFQGVLVVSDAAVVCVSFWLAYIVRFSGVFSIFQNEVIGSETFYLGLLLKIVPIWLAVFWLNGLYQSRHLLGGTEEYARIFRASTAGFLLVIFADFLSPALTIARGWLILSWIFAFLLTFVERFFLRRVIYALRLRGYFLSKTVIVGANPEGMSLARQLASGQKSGLVLAGFIDNKFRPGAAIAGRWYVLGGVDQIDQIVAQHGISEIILASSAYSTRDHLIELFRKFGTCDEINIRMSSGLYEIITTGLTVKDLAGVPLVHVNKIRMTGIDMALKIGLDCLITLPALFFLTPLILALALAVKFDSPGPAIHRRRVMGVNGRQFDAYKLRTMYVDGDRILNQHPKLKAELARNGKLKDDPRITRLGRVLRKFSLDELPQLFNVIKLDMSLVGPRMISPAEMEHYTRWGINLLTVRPGITGLWQVSGRSDVTYEERVKMDMHYIRNWSIWLDLQLLFRTIPVVLHGRGAY